MNIGITISIYEDNNIWCNGILQNVVNLYLLLKNISDDYNVYIMNTSENKNIEYDLDTISINQIEDIIDKIDIVIIMGSQLKDEYYNFIRNKNGKIIYYVCGSHYFNDMEEVLFKNNSSYVRKNIPDEIWIIPQNYETNKHYLEALYNVPVKSTPFIWSPIFIDYYIKNSGEEWFYKKTNDKKRISCFEPNINVVKYSMYNILICELLYNERPDLIGKLYITNTKHIREKKLYIDTMNYFNIVKNGIATFENTYILPFFLQNYTDVVISHQIYNPLNYLYLDALYLNYPLVHNADMIKDAGYYYERFDAKVGKEKLLYALEHHDEHLEEYNINNKKVLERYLPTNKDLIKIYDEMIKNIINKYANKL